MPYTRIAAPRTPAKIGNHEGPCREFLDAYRASVAEAVLQGESALQTFWPRLLDTVSDERNLRAAWDYLSRKGGQAPGPNKQTYRDCSQSETWSLLRALRDAIRAGTYQVGPFRRQRVPKSSGNGHRTLLIQNIQDRVVSRATKQIVEPLVDPFFSPDSYGFRPGRSRQQALARAESLARDGHLIWVADDVKDCFDNVPRNRLRDILRRRLPEEVVDLTLMLVSTGNRKGVIQGNPLSPLLVNIYLHHFLDRPWHRDHPDTPLIRYADDILILCRTPEKASESYDDLRRKLTDTGMPLKGNVDTAITNLQTGDRVQWLGYALGSHDNRLTNRIGERAWRSLASKFEDAHHKPNSPLAAREAVSGWIKQMAPCFRDEHPQDVCQRVLDLARDQAFDELPARQHLQESWQQAHHQYLAVVNAESDSVDSDDDTPEETEVFDEPF